MGSSWGQARYTQRGNAQSGIRYQVSYLDWGTFSHRLFLQAPSKMHPMAKGRMERALTGQSS